MPTARVNGITVNYEIDGASSARDTIVLINVLADDAKALVDTLGLSGFHLMGVSMGGMISQEYAIAYPGDLKSVTLACTYGKADPFCQTMFAMWADIARKVDVPFVM